jgi:hypothetical protein
MIDIPEETAGSCRKLCQAIVDDKNYDELKHAVLMASPSGESQGESTALICHGRLLSVRDVFDLLERVARPPKKIKPSPAGSGSKDPDLDDGE